MSPATFVATWFGAGLFPKAPGTIGSLAALPFAAAFIYWTNPFVLVAAAVVVFIVGIRACDVYIRELGRDDPSSAVIDEVAAQWLVLACLQLGWWQYLLGFLAFRLFDVLKPWPVSWFDRRIKGGLGVMVDDVIAAVYAIAALYLFGLITGTLDALFF